MTKKGRFIKVAKEEKRGNRRVGRKKKRKRRKLNKKESSRRKRIRNESTTEVTRGKTKEGRDKREGLEKGRGKGGRGGS